MPLANDHIMLGTLIRSFRHLKHQNLSIGDEFINTSGKKLLVSFLATKEALNRLLMILSCGKINTFF